MKASNHDHECLYMRPRPYIESLVSFPLILPVTLALNVTHHGSFSLSRAIHHGRLQRNVPANNESENALFHRVALDFSRDPTLAQDDTDKMVGLEFIPRISWRRMRYHDMPRSDLSDSSFADTAGRRTATRSTGRSTTTGSRSNRAGARSSSPSPETRTSVSTHAGRVHAAEMGLGMMLHHAV